MTLVPIHNYIKYEIKIIIEFIVEKGENGLISEVELVLIRNFVQLPFKVYLHLLEEKVVHILSF